MVHNWGRTAVADPERGAVGTCPPVQGPKNKNRSDASSEALDFKTHPEHTRGWLCQLW